MEEIGQCKDKKEEEQKRKEDLIEYNSKKNSEEGENLEDSNLLIKEQNQNGLINIQETLPERHSLSYYHNPQFQYLDNLIETFSFSRYHFSTLAVCSFCTMTAAYQTTHYFFCRNLLIKKYSWSNLEYSLIFIFQNVFGGIGAFISVCTTTKEWDIISNTIISLISLVSLIMLLFFNESLFFIIVMFIFNYCQGFIYNITFNFLLEEMKFKYRDLLFLLCLSFKFISNMLFGLVEYLIYDIFRNISPIDSLIGLVLLQAGLFISLIFFTESPRLMYYNEEFQKLYKYIEYTTVPDVKPYKHKIIKTLIETENSIVRKFESQKYTSFITHFKQLWDGPYLILSLKAMVFVFLSNFFMSNLKDSYSYFAKNESKYLLIISEDNGPHYLIGIYYGAGYLGYMLLLLFKYLFKPIRLIYTLSSLSICFLFLLFMVLIEKYYIYFLGVFEVFANFYYFVAYMYFSTFITSQLRNSMTSLLYITNSFSYIFQSLLMNSIESYPLFGYINFGIAIILILSEILLIKEDGGTMKCQEIEIKLLKRSKIDKENKKKELEEMNRNA